MPIALKKKATDKAATLEFERSKDGCLVLCLGGNWRLAEELPGADRFERQLTAGPTPTGICFKTEGLESWDTGLLIFIDKLLALGKKHHLPVGLDGLPKGASRLMQMAIEGRGKESVGRDICRDSVLCRLGSWALTGGRSSLGMLAFGGDTFVSILRLVTGRARYRRSDLYLFIQESGAQALPIVTLISILVGVILAFVGAVQLQMFGAEIYVANLVGIGMVRDMGAMMAAVIMAGRTGAAYAAQLGTMQVNEEIDALQTLGIPPIDFLVLPRLLALSLMMPLLCCYADLMGIIGGGLVGVGLFDITSEQYYQQTKDAIALRHFGVGLIKSVVYGLIIALAGCLKGIQCGRSASAVGAATTSAVVTAIVWIIVWCAALTVVFYMLGV